MNTIGRRRHAGNLRPRGLQPMIIHDDLARRRIDMHIGGCNMRGREFRPQIVRQNCATLFPTRFQDGELRIRHRRRFGGEARSRQLQAAGNVDRPGTDHIVGVREPDETALMVGEIQVVATQPVRNPIGHPNQRRPLDIDPNTRMQVRPNNRPVQQPFHPKRHDACRLRIMVE